MYCLGIVGVGSKFGLIGAGFGVNVGFGIFWSGVGLLLVGGAFVAGRAFVVTF